MFIDFLQDPQVQKGIFILILVALGLNFLIKLSLIKAGIYKRVYKQHRIDWEKIKGGGVLLGFAGILIASSRYSIPGWQTFLILVGFLGGSIIISGLFFSRRSWKSHKYWD